MRMDDVIEINAIRQCQLFGLRQQLKEVPPLSTVETCAGFELLQFVSLQDISESGVFGTTLNGESNTNAQPPPVEASLVTADNSNEVPSEPASDSTLNPASSASGTDTTSSAIPAIPPKDADSEENAKAVAARERADRERDTMMTGRALTEFRKQRHTSPFDTITDGEWNRLITKADKVVAENDKQRVLDFIARYKAENSTSVSA